MDLPQALEERLHFYLKQFAPIPDDEALKTLLLTSDYALRQIAILKELCFSYATDLKFGDYCCLLQKINASSLASYGKALRQFKHRQLLSLLLRELSGLAATKACMTAWSDCADAIILKTLECCECHLKPRYGSPLDNEGRSTELYVLAMGKLGGQELNYSSDVDLIFVYSAPGFTNGKEQLSNQLYYTKVVQLFIQLLQELTPEGFVFRVDLRLRPHGDSGALILNLAAMETYYQEQGRDWERYAMVKARLIGQDTTHLSHWFHRLITPFVYRRYVDFSVIESLRSMKAMIEREIRLNPMLNDIKRGLGGIREIEFIIQTIQLIRAGRLPSLQKQNTLASLHELSANNLLPHARVLSQAYLFLRKLENMLQAQNDQQTHTLPQETIKQVQLALLMGYASWQQLSDKLQQYQRIVSLSFRSVLAKAIPYEDEKRVLAHQLMSIWQGHVEMDMAVNLLTSLGFQQAKRCYQMLHAFRHGPRCRRLTQAARMHLDRFMVFLLCELCGKATEFILLQVLQLLENILSRRAYLALLAENPQVLNELLSWFAHSPFITGLLVSQPFLLEVLLESEEHWRLPSRRQLEQQLNKQLTYCFEDEQKEDLLRQFKLTNWLSAARAERYGRYHVIKIGGFLADVAAVIVAKVFALAAEQLRRRYPRMKTVQARFAILAYGSLGSREMNYNSDLDLVFIHASAAEDEALVNRLTQKILHMLTMRSQRGILYTVDRRLRPSGKAGLLVSQVDAFSQYQLQHAWVWEHQALIRARVLTGNRSIKQKLKQLKEQIFLKPRDKFKLRDEVLDMREKINKHARFDQLKHAPGGLIDLEFLLQFLVLTHPLIKPVPTNLFRLLQTLATAEIINQEQFIKLKRAYKAFHQRLHQNLLNSKIEDKDFEPHLQAVAAVCKEIYGRLGLKV